MPNSPKHSGSKARLLFDPTELAYDFGSQHPMQSHRLVALIDLLEASGLWRQTDESTRLDGRMATLDELKLIHTTAYLSAVQDLRTFRVPAGNTEEEQKTREKLARHYGLGDGDTPIFPGMHDAAARIAGGTLVALSTVMGLSEGKPSHTKEDSPLQVFHPAGGWHHAMPARASGFCVYNDIAIAIAHVQRACEAKVLYIDFDAHHGDGVQQAFYDDPRVMTISFHETGRYLFPGTGDVFELGQGTGRGTCVNIPLEPFTEDDSYIEIMRVLLPPLVASFAPDVIISMHGCDAHAWDPLTHLELTMRSFQAQASLTCQLAQTYCQGRWVALGGGGYDFYRVTPRAWSILWAEMSGKPLPERLPEEWVRRWKPIWEQSQKNEETLPAVMEKDLSRAIFPTTFQDHAEDFSAQPRRWQISQTNRQTAALVRYLHLPAVIRHAFPSRRHRTPLADPFDLLSLRKSDAVSRSKKLETKAGVVLLRDTCPASLIERLEVDEGLHAFASLPEREHQLLLTIAQSPDCVLTVAHTPEGKIIGQVTIAPADDWWEGIDSLYEVAVEVSSHWRRLGIAGAMLAFALELDILEDSILFATGLSWHWDLASLDISSHHYRQLIAQLFARQGFEEYSTTQPDIRTDPANIFLARIGKRVAARTKNQFLSRLSRTRQFSRL
jgi:acetoin utilization deacetylase AcuC-like enzyme/GNAT superfamily N-acetyltransferase